MKTMTRGFIVVIVLATIVLSAIAQISPGNLSKYHAKLEGLNKCTKCHALGEEVTNDNCLTCHTLIKDQIAANRGYHSSSDVKGLKCTKCHAEHYDTEFELVHWKEGKENFDHAKTGWELLGAHKQAGCRNCHTLELIVSEAVRTSDQLDPARTYLGLGTACLDCHVNEHQGKFAENCLSCHTQDAWKPASGFDHAKTAYPLTGKHVETSCDVTCSQLLLLLIRLGKFRKKSASGCMRNTISSSLQTAHRVIPMLTRGNSVWIAQAVTRRQVFSRLSIRSLIMLRPVLLCWANILDWIA
jgi:hypothetical protein